jgi:hypothetical protein
MVAAAAEVAAGVVEVAGVAAGMVEVAGMALEVVWMVDLQSAQQALPRR